MNHPLQCRCGRLKGYVSHPQKANRGVCYCKNCQAYAHSLGKADDVLDEMGGTDVVATLSQYVTFTDGIDALACLSLSPNGLLRWYASCCDTPIGNTLRNVKVPYVGLVHTCLGGQSKTIESSFGLVRMRANTKNAKGKPASMPVTTIASALRILASLIRARLDGSYQRTPFFVPNLGTPVVSPRVLTKSEREQATIAAT